MVTAMARKVRSVKLYTRTARRELKQRREPYWQILTRGRSIGYRRGERGGTWIARLQESSGRKLYGALGLADDIEDADGVRVLDFGQAQDAAHRWFRGKLVELNGPVAPAGAYTVSDACKAYMAAYRAGRTKGGGKAASATQAIIDAHIAPELGPVAVAALTSALIDGWLTRLAGRREADGENPDGARRSKATANRVLTILKAVLNWAWHHERVASDSAWRRVKPFGNVENPVVRYLTEAEALRLVNAVDASFRPMVRAALLTGARYGELARLRASDVNPDAGMLSIRIAKGGKGRHVVLTDEAKEFFAQSTRSRERGELLFTRKDGSTWGKSHQHRLMRSGCNAAKISPAVSFHVLRHTHGSLLAMKGVPLQVIAKQLGHADIRMTERHYAHLAPDYVATEIREKMPRLGIVEKSNVKALKPRRKTARGGTA